MSVNRAAATVSAAPATARGLAKWRGDHADRQIVVMAATASSMLNNSPAARAVNPAWTLSVSTRTGKRKRLVPMMSCAPTRGNRRTRSRWRGKKLISMHTLLEETVETAGYALST
jgi:hypothetical protein